MDEFEKNLPNVDKKEGTAVTSKRKLRRFTKIVLVLIILGLGLLAYNMFGCNKRTTEIVYEFENGANYQIAEYDGKILTLTYDGVKILRPNGKQKTEINYNMSNPHMNINSNMILLYDKDSNKMAVYDGTRKKYSYESDQKIRSAKVNKNGYSVVISDETGYNSKIEVIDKNGKVKYKWRIGSEYVVDADISPDNKNLVASTITTNTGSIVENIIFVDIEKAVEKSRVKANNIMPLQVKFTKNGSVVAVSDTKICGYSHSGKKTWENSFESNILDSFSIDEDGNTVVSLGGIKNNSVLKVYSPKGREICEYVTETQATHVDLSSKHIAVCEKGKVSLIKLSGRLSSSVKLQREVLDMSTIGNDKVIILCGDSIQLIRM